MKTTPLGVPQVAAIRGRTPAYLQTLQCLGCGAVYPPDTLMNLCFGDQRPVQMVLDLDQLQREQPNQSWYHPDREDMWRFGGLMPLDSARADDREDIVSLGEGATMLQDLPDYPLAKRAGFRLRVKNEAVNPTGSFKDRGMSVVVSMARRMGVRGLVVPTQGNAGDSLAVYAVAGGLKVAVIMPDDTPAPIISRVSELSRKHAHVVLELVSGTIREASQVMDEIYLPQGYFNCATFQEPGWRIEGKKTLGLEIAEPTANGGEWHLPDVIVYPTGGGTGIVGMWKAFDELQVLGLIGSERPRMICVQSAATAPVVEAFDAGADDTTPVEPGKTLATGLNVPGGVGHQRVLGIIRASSGAAVSVTEEEIASALQELWREHGLWYGPEGAACFAALEQLVQRGLINKGDEVVTFNTGAFDKYLPELKHLL
ncbi:MAG: threonine synthase [Gammaproteobacteria bacterium]|nr:MAG: threonine synthase [Gammaproteobacteria bacterium]